MCIYTLAFEYITLLFAPGKQNFTCTPLLENKMCAGVHMVVWLINTALCSLCHLHGYLQLTSNGILLQKKNKKKIGAK